MDSLGGFSLATRSHFWTHPSVLRLPRTEDPVKYVTERAREVVFGAIEAGWTGPPFDPFALAEHMKIAVVPQDDILDARTVPLEGGQFQIEFNPNRPKGRIRFSIAHELAHTLFPDCHERVRNRAAREHTLEQDWQLELLCNVAAAELLMPIGSFPDLKEKALSIDALMELRRRYDVSTEALLLRAVRLTDTPCTVFCTSRQEQDQTNQRYRIDYAVGSKSWTHGLGNGTLLPESTVIRECTAIGFTAKGSEAWSGVPEHLHVEAIGLPPYPKHRYPRVAGIAHVPNEGSPKQPMIKYLRGDATEPRGPGVRIICHVVNDKAAKWGGGFARVVRRRLPQAQEDFISWTEGNRNDFALGEARLCPIDDSLEVFSMVCQHGYGASRTPRIRYGPMKKCLERLAEIAGKKEATVHMPRIGCGQAGGSWSIVSELIDETLCSRGIPVTVYDLPNSDAPQPPSQGELFSIREL
jgi:O-acetyl-ADP-ribose deacetylase (regulator of RNase III)